MRFGFIGAAAAALCVAMPAQAAVVVVQVDALARGTIERSEIKCGGVCSSTPESRYFTYSTAIDLAEGAFTTFSVGPGANAGVFAGTITRNGYDMYGAVNYVGSNFVFTQDQLIIGTSGSITGAVQTRLRASTFTVRQIIPAPVPEPATWAMMILGFGLAGWAIRRRKMASPAFN